MRRKIGELVPVERKWLNVNEAAEYMGCSKDHIAKLRDQAKIAFAKFGRSYLYSLESIDRYINRHIVISVSQANKT